MSKLLYKGPLIQGFPARFIADLLHISESVWQAHPGVVRPYLKLRQELLAKHGEFKGCCIATVDDGQGVAILTDRPVSRWELGGRHFWNRLDKDVLEDAKAIGLPAVTFTNDRVDYGKEVSIKATYALAECLLADDILLDAKAARVAQSTTAAHKAFSKHCGAYLKGFHDSGCFSKTGPSLTSAIQQCLDGTTVDPTLLLTAMNVELASHCIEEPPAAKKETILKKARAKKATTKQTKPKAGGRKNARQKVRS